MSHNEQPIITARAEVAVGIDQARRWFLALEEHPERYQFDTHAGFRFTQGNFGQAGARFETEEWFLGLKLTLRFELTEVDDEQVRFRVLRPSVPVWGAFVLERVSEDVTCIHLDVGGTRSAGAFFLRLPGVRGAVQRQIQSEVEHIRDSIHYALNTGHSARVS
jgi:hypothetical protein